MAWTRQLRDLTKEGKFGRLTPMERLTRGDDGHVRYRCDCDCGRKGYVIRGDAIAYSNRIPNCGCIRNESCAKTNARKAAAKALAALRPELTPIIEAGPMELVDISRGLLTDGALEALKGCGIIAFRHTRLESRIEGWRTGHHEATLEIPVGARFEQYTKLKDPDHILDIHRNAKCYADIANTEDSNVHGLLEILQPGDMLKLRWKRDIEQGAAFAAGFHTDQLYIEIDRVVGDKDRRIAMLLVVNVSPNGKNRMIQRNPF